MKRITRRIPALPIVMALMVSLVLATCTLGPSSDSDSWSDVTSLDQLSGAWQGSLSQTMPLRQLMEFQGYVWDASFQAFYGNMNVRYTLDLSATINSAARKITGVGRETAVFSVGNIISVWPSLRNEYIRRGATVNDSNYSMTYAEPINESISLSDFEGTQINQNGNKMREPASNAGFPSNDYLVMTKI